MFDQLSLNLPTDIAGMQPQIISGKVEGALTGLSTKVSSKAVAQSVSAQCDVVQVKLYRLQNDGSIDDTAALATTTVDDKDYYLFDLNELKIDDSASTVGLVVRAEDCAGSFLNRPITGYNTSQHIDVRSTVISQIVNAGSLVNKQLNEAQKSEVENLIRTVSGATNEDVIDSLTNSAQPAAIFTQIFGASPNVIKDVRPEVQFTLPVNIFNEQQTNPLTVTTFHVDPNYSFVYKWKLDGVLRSSAKTWNYIPHANAAGSHQVDVYVGKDDGLGEIDLTKPYYTKTFMITIGNNIQPVAPNLTIDASTPSPRTTNSIQLNISTGVNLANCESFSHMAVTESATAPGIMQFNIDCTTSGTQTLNVNFDSTNGNKELHLWAIDELGVVSLSKSVSFVLDTQIPNASMTLAAGAKRGGSSETITLSASDTTTGLANLNLYLAYDSGSYALVEALATSATSYVWSVPALNTTSATLQLVATDNAGLARQVYSSAFAIDSLAPSAPALTRTTPAITSASTVLMTLGSCADISSVLITESNVQPLATAGSWQACSTSASAISALLSGDGSHTLYAWAKDTVGNVATSANSVSVFYDSTAPNIISGPSLPAILQGGATSVAITWTVSDASAAAIQLEAFDGTSWTTIATNQAKTGPFTWNSVPMVSTYSAKIRLTAVDAAGLVTVQESPNFTIDSVVPDASVSIAAGLKRGGSSETVTYTVSDATTAISNVTLQYAADAGSYNTITSIASATSGNYAWTLPLINTTSATVRLIATDSAGLSRTVYSGQFGIDSLAPSAPSLTRNSDINTQNSTVLMTLGSCTDIDSVLITETNVKPAFSVAGWQTCNTNASGISTVVTGNGSHTLYAWAKDAVGNVANSANNVQMFLDTISPTVTAGPTISSAVSGGVSSVAITWTVSDASQAAIQLEAYDGSSWSTLATSQTKSGSFNWTSVPVVTTDQARLRLTAVDLAGNSVQQLSPNFIIDSTLPVANSLVINGGVSGTNNKNVLINFSATDDIANITAFCLRYNNVAHPAANDSCWTTLQAISVPESKNISINNYQFQVGSVVGEYNVTVWWKNAAGLISTLSGQGTANVDSFIVNFTPDPPPDLSNIIAAGFDTSTSPLGVSDTTVLFGEDLYIKWTIDDNIAIPAGNVTLQYTTNDTSFTTVANGLSNGINGDCTISGAETGCYKWVAASPTNSYYRIRLVVTDAGGSIVFDVSNPLNTGKIKFLSGNTSIGIGGAATKAVLFSPNESSYTDNNDNQALVVTKTGYVFFRSQGRGLVYVSPQDGIIRDVALETGTTPTGDGGSVFAATFRDIHRMAIDYDDNVIVWDYDKVRKINTHTTPWSVSTLFGGGGSSADGADALSASISSSYSDQLTVTPNGRIYFNKSNQIWYYDPTDSKVKMHIALTGTGTDDMASWRATFDNVACSGLNAAFTFTKADSAITKIMRRMSSSTSASCGSAAASYPYYNTNFDLTTGVATAPHPPQTVWSSHKFTGLDGNIYVLNQGRGSLKKYNAATNTFDTVLGNGVNGRCEDGTAALSCPVVVMAAFVSEFGRIYFVDLGVIRTVDSSGLVQTIAGQPRNFGVGHNPISARYSQVAFFEKSGDDIYIKNEQENMLVKFSLTGGNLVHIAGNTERGTPSTAVSATATRMPSCGWGMPCSFVVDSVNNRIYHYSSNNNVAYIDLATGDWVNQGSNVVQDANARVSYVGINNNELLIYAPSHYGVSGDKVSIRSVNQTSLASTIVYGTTDISTTLSGTVCVGVSSTSCTIAHTSSDSVQTRYKYDTNTSSWLFTMRGGNSLYTLPTLGGVVNLFETMANNFISYDYYKDGADEFIYYCSTSGNLYKRNVVTNAETHLTLPISTMNCASNSLFYDSARDSLFFVYRQNNMFGVAEYTDP